MCFPHLVIFDIIHDSLMFGILTNGPYIEIHMHLVISQMVNKHLLIVPLKWSFFQFVHEILCTVFLCLMTLLCISSRV